MRHWQVAPKTVKTAIAAIDDDAWTAIEYTDAVFDEAAGQDTLFDVWRFHAFFTTADPHALDTVTADRTHRGHTVIEQAQADLKNSSLAHLPSGVFTANAAWLVLAVIAFNLTRAAGTLAAPNLAKATTRPCVAS